MPLNTSFATRTYLLAVAIMVLFSVIIFINGLSGPFIWDDKHLILTNTKIKDWTHFSETMSADFWSIPQLSLQSGYYRPVITLSYMLSYTLFEMNPYGYHVTNLYFHIANVLLIYWLAFLLFQKQLPALVAGLLFAAHPMHTESVTWIAGRTDIMATFFLLLACITFIKNLSSRNSYWYSIALLCYPLALLTKEIAIVLPLLFLLYDYIIAAQGQWRETWRRFPKYHLPFLLLSLLYPLLKFCILGIFISPLPLYADTRFLAIINAFKLLFSYFQLLLLPLSFNLERDIPVINNVFSSETFFYTLFVLLLFVLICWTRHRASLIAFGLSWIVVTLLPVLNIIPVGDYIAERFLYLPSVGFVLCVAYGFSHFPVTTRAGLFSPLSRRAVLSILLFSLLAFYAVQTIRRNADWQDEIRLWTTTLHSSPNSIRAYMLLAIAYYEHGQLEEALRLYQQAALLDSSNEDLYHDLGKLYYHLGRRDEAIAHYQTLLKRFPHKEKTYLMLGILWREKHQYAKALDYLQKAMTLSAPEHVPEYHLLLGATYQDQGNLDAAISEYQQALTLAPHMFNVYPFLWGAYKAKGTAKHMAMVSQQAIQAGTADTLETYYYAGIAYEEQRMLPQALEVYQAALQKAPRSFLFHYRSGEIYDQLEKRDLAESAYETALNFHFNFAPAHYSLGNIYMRKGLLEQAVVSYERALRFDPHLDKARYNLALVSYDLGTFYMQAHQKEEAIQSYQRFLRYWQGDPQYTSMAQNRLKELLP